MSREGFQEEGHRRPGAWLQGQGETTSDDRTVDVPAGEPAGSGRAHDPGGDAGGGGEAAGRRPSVAHRVWAWLDTRSALRAVQALVVATALVAVWLTFEQAKQVDCQAQYNARVAAYDAQRADAAQRDRAALENLVRSLLDPASDSVAEAEEYLATLEQTNRERAASPVVPPPADLCA